MASTSNQFWVDISRAFIICFLVGCYLLHDVNVMQSVFKFPDREVDLHDYPPPFVAWGLAIIDTICGPLPCREWRNSFELKEGDWFTRKVPSVLGARPPLLSYGEFCESSGLPTVSFQTAYVYAFETPATQLGDLGEPTAFCVMLFVLCVVRMIKSFLLPRFRELGRLAARHEHGAEWESKPGNQGRIDKFAEYMYRLVFHSTISVFGYLCFRDTEWWKRDGFTFTGMDATMSEYHTHPVSPSMAWYYMVQAAYNFDAMISLLELSFDVRFQNPFVMPIRTPIRISWSSTVRGDFSEMMIHHLATNFLVIGSSVCRLTRAGSMVFLIHDVSDVPVDLSKLANFVKWKVTTIVCFAFMVVSWVITRLYILPFVILGNYLKSSHIFMDDGLDPMLYVCYRHFFYTMLEVLVLLHVTWFLMFIRMFKTLVLRNEIHDYSEHKEGETDEGQQREGETDEGQQREGETDEGQQREGETDEGQQRQGETDEGQQRQGETDEGQQRQGETDEGHRRQGETNEGQRQEGVTEAESEDKKSR